MLHGLPLRVVLLLLLLLPGLAAGSAAAETRLEFATDASAFDSGEYRYTLTSPDMEAEDVLALPATAWRTGAAEPNFGYTDQALWMRGRIRNDTAVPLVYATEHYGVNRVDLYVLASRGAISTYLGSFGWALVETGEALTPERTSAYDSIASIQMRIDPGTPREVLFRVSSSSLLTPQIMIRGEQNFNDTSAVWSLWQGISLGAIVLLLLISFMVALRGRSPLYWTHFLLVTAFLFSIAYLNGYGPLALWERLPGLTLFLGQTLSPIVVLVFSAFLIRFLDTGQLTPRLHAAVRILQLVSLATILVMALLPSLLAYQVFNWVTLPLLLALLGLLVIGAFLRLRGAGTLLASWSVVVFIAGIAFFATRGPDISLFVVHAVPSMAPVVLAALLTYALFTRLTNERATERIRRREAEAEAAEMREQRLVDDRLRTLAEMAGNVSHELQTPLGVAVTAGSHLRSRAEKTAAARQSGEAGEQELVEFLEEGRSVGELIETTMEQSRSLAEGFKVVATDQAHPKVQSIEVNSYLERFGSIFRLRFKHTPHKLYVAGGPPLEIDTFPGILTQALGNLVENAVRHAFPQGHAGTVTIQHQPLQGAGAVVRIEVLDDGIGIPREYLSRIFEPQFTTARSHGGTGLGLSIVRTLVEEKLGGTIRVENRKGGGTIAAIELGAVTQAAES